jgi:bifunctional DNA-binding transcriptional regulator/antitoxin component of YhaV-PrlF toxin-antitoxin module
LVELITKITKGGVLYIPKEIREAFGRNMKIIPDASAALFFPKDADYEDVLGSLQVITMDVQHRIQMLQRAKNRGG